tara:strand:- start:1920 stop:2891 length:972 start_codon:yes stop_codon:yes gene_type:complete
MKKPIAIIAGEPNSISSEIIFKSWKQRKKYTNKPIVVIGNFNLLIMQRNKLKHKIKIKKINDNFKYKELIGNYLPVYNVNYKQNKPFINISSKSNKFIIECFNKALDFVNNKKILGFVNCPISKEFLFKKKYQGVTEFLSKKSGTAGNEVMLIYNKKLSVSPLTSHIPLSEVTKKLSQSKIIKKIKTINNFYKKFFKKKPKIGILGLNPHNFSPKKNFEEKKIIIPAIKKLKKFKIKAMGPMAPDTAFSLAKKYNLDVIFGMYHDQVLAPYKTMFDFNAINITLGLPYIRISPDHGTAENITGKNIANPKSLIESIKFFNYIY